MDPSIMKLFEDDEDDTMHSGPDLEAFTAALNRDIGRHDGGVSPPTDPTASVGQSQTSNQEGIHIQSNMEQTEQQSKIQEQHSSQMGRINQEYVMDLCQESSRQAGREQSHLVWEENREGQQEIGPGNAKDVEMNQIPYTEQKHSLSQEENAAKESGNLQQNPTKQLINQQPQSSEQANNPTRRIKLNSISFYALIPILRPHIDKDRFMLLNDVFLKLKANEISKDDFLRVIRNTVGDKMLRQAVHTVMQAQAFSARNSQASHNPRQGQAPTFSQQLPHRNAWIPENQSFSQVHPVSSTQQIGASTVKNQINASFIGTENSGRNSVVMENRDNSWGMPAIQISSTNMITIKKEREDSLQTCNKMENHSQLPPTSFLMQHGSTMGSFFTHQFPRPNGGGTTASLKSQTQESQHRKIPLPQGIPLSQSGETGPINHLNTCKTLQDSSLSNHSSQLTLQDNQFPWQTPSNKERRGNHSSSMMYVKQEVTEQSEESPSGAQHSVPQSSSVIVSGQMNSSLSKDIQIENSPSRMAFYTNMNAVPGPHVTGTTVFSPDQAIQMRPQIHSTSLPALTGPNARSALKKPSIGQKKPQEAQGTPPLPSKRQKVSGAFQDQSIEQLNDVTAVSGVNLREEEEQLFTTPKEENRASEATRRVVQEEEERLVVQKRSLRKKMAEIMYKCGIKNGGTDVERCLSMCVEERLRGFISNLIRISNQRVDSEKSRHRIVFTSDVRREVLAMNRKAKEELDKKQAKEAEKHRKLNDGEGNVGADAENDRDEGRSRTPKANKDEDDKMRATAANVAARAAVGGDDVLSKWQLMAEQARQKREVSGGLDGGSPSEFGKAVVDKQNSEKTSKDGHGDKKGSCTPSGVMRKFGRNTATMSRVKVERTISVGDVIAVLEREPQMTKSILLYRLFGKISDGSSTM